MDILVIGNNPTQLGHVALMQRLHQNQNTVSMGIDKAIEYLKSNTPDAVIMCDPNDSDMERVKKVYNGQVGGLRFNKQCFHINSIDRRIGVFFGQYGLSGILNTPFAYLVKVFCLLMNRIGIRLVFARLFTERLGHLACNNHILLSKLNDGRRKVIIGFYSGSTASEQLLKLYKREFNFLIRNKWLSGLVENDVIKQSGFYVDGQFTTDAVIPTHTLKNRVFVGDNYTDKELEQMWSLEQRLGLHDYICLHVRDKAYLDTVANGMNHNYHNFRDADIETYKDAVDWITSLEDDIKAVRVGIIAEKPISFASKKVIDLPYSKENTDFNQMALVANCMFLLGSTSGMPAVAMVQGVPSAVANWAHIELMTCFNEGDMIIPKRLWYNPEGRYLRLSEILACGAGRFHRAEFFQSANIDVEDNKPEDIKALAEEMYCRIKGIWVDTPEDQELQSKFRAIINQPQYLCSGTQARIATSWLRKYPEWSE